MSDSETAAILSYASGESYKIKGWTSIAADKTTGPYSSPAKLYRLGPNGWHYLETMDSTRGSQSTKLKSRDELIEMAQEAIETVYEAPNPSDVIHIREFPIDV